MNKEIEKVILVDSNDNPVGTMEKIEAHRKGARHRAFSVHIFNSKGELMLQRRAADKYHCGGLWTNTCCSHQREEEDTLAAAARRLKEEMGIECPLKEVFSFVYEAGFDNGLTEHEYDHVLVGYFDGEPSLNPEEADRWRWISRSELEKEIRDTPQHFTPWFRIIIGEYFNRIHG